MELLVVESFQGRVTGDELVAPEKFTGKVRGAEVTGEARPIEDTLDDGDDLEVFTGQARALNAEQRTSSVDHVFDQRRTRKEQLTVAEMSQFHVVHLMRNHFSLSRSTLTNDQQTNRRGDQLRDRQIP